MKTFRHLIFALAWLVVAACGQVPEVRSPLDPDLKPQAGPVFESQKLLASDGEVQDFFGESVSISGNVAIVGAQGHNNTGSFIGSAYIYRLTSSGWAEEAELLASDGADFDALGKSVSVSGNVAIVGAPGDDDNGHSSGSAYIYRRTSGGWVEEAKLLASDGNGLDHFGRSVSISGDLAIVSAPDDEDNGHLSGSAYIYRRTSGGWVEEVKLSDSSEQDYFGRSVSISGNLAIVGAHGHDSLTGSAYIYRRTSAGWVEEAELLASDGVSGDLFGSSVSVSGNVAVVGANGDDENGRLSGSSYIYRRTSSGWVEEAELLASDGVSGDLFGSSVSVSGNVAVVGARFDDDHGNSAGSAYIYRRTSGSWMEEAKLLSSSGMSEEYLGESVSVSGNVAVVGAPGHDNYRGYANIYVLDEGATTPPPPPPPTFTCGGLYEAAKQFAVGWDDDTCTVEPDDCYWTLCEAPPELWLVPTEPCITCDLILTVPKDLDLHLSVTLPYLTDDPGLFKEMVEVGLYTLEGKPVSYGELDYVVFGNQEGYGLRLEGYVAAGDYQLRLSISDEAFAEELLGNPFAFIFDSGK